MCLRVLAVIDPPLRVGIPYRNRAQGNPMTVSYSQDFGPFDGKVWLNCIDRALSVLNRDRAHMTRRRHS